MLRPLTVLMGLGGRACPGPRRRLCGRRQDRTWPHRQSEAEAVRTALLRQSEAVLTALLSLPQRKLPGPTSSSSTLRSMLPLVVVVVGPWAASGVGSR
eukprot:2418393-Rhodomonas_salina.3